jgi:hypothetical protein
MVYSGGPLSGSTNGRPIPVAATATPGTLIHTVVGGSSAFDEVYLFASNVTAAPATLTVEFGGVADPGDHLVKGYSIAANSGPIPISPMGGARLQGGVVIRAFSGTASAINITGAYNRAQ